MPTANKAAIIFSFILLSILLTIIVIYTVVIFCERKNKKETVCATELLGSLVNITSEEAKNQCISESLSKLHMYGITIIYFMYILIRILIICMKH